MYYDIKSQLFSLFPLDGDATLVLFGLLLWLIGGLVFRLPMTKLVSLAPLVIICVAVEIADVALLSQAPFKAVIDFSIVVIPTFIIVLFQHQGWART